MALKLNLEGLEQWEVEVNEVSAGRYKLRAVRKTGNLFEESGSEMEALIAKLREFELGIQKAFEKRKARS
jgi:hypothetical protein